MNFLRLSNSIYFSLIRSCLSFIFIARFSFSFNIHDSSNCFRFIAREELLSGYKHSCFELKAVLLLWSCFVDILLLFNKSSPCRGLVAKRRLDKGRLTLDVKFSVNVFLFLIKVSLGCFVKKSIENTLA